jgi:hypothetical protein
MILDANNPDSLNDFVGSLIDVSRYSDCAKRTFVAAATNKDGEVLGYSTNLRLPYHSFLCKGECIRSKIDSGTDSMLGACGHAEEQLLWSLAHDGAVKDCEMWVVQVKDGQIVPEKEKSFYCARCATQMYYAKAKGVWVYVVDHFEFLTTEEAIKSAYEFALGEKKA